MPVTLQAYILPQFSLIKITLYIFLLSYLMLGASVTFKIVIATISLILQIKLEIRIIRDNY